MARHLAVDYGAKRVGLATSDADGTLAAPHSVLTVATPADALAQVAGVVADEQAEVLIVGCPFDMSGRIGQAARAAAVWAQALHERTGVQVVLVDERLSSFAAEQQIIGRKRGGEKMTRAQKKRQLDAVAAAAFLAEYLRGDLEAWTPADVIKQV